MEVVVSYQNKAIHAATKNEKKLLPNRLLNMKE